MDEELSWEITSSEKRRQIEKGIFVAGPLILMFLIFFPPYLSSQRRINLKEIIFSILFTILGLFIVWIVNKIVPYKKRIYTLNNEGLLISKGNKVEKYLWADFTYFFNYSARHGNISGNDRRKEIFEVEKSIEGDVFYLLKNNKGIFSKIYKVFVAVYSNVGNREAVGAFLSKHLSKQKMKDTTDMGLVFYKFK